MSTLVYGSSDDLIIVVSDNGLTSEITANDTGKTRVKIEGEGERFTLAIEYDGRRDGVWDVRIPSCSNTDDWERIEYYKVTDEVEVDYTDVMKLDIEAEDIEKLN